MLKGFENITFELTDKEKELIPIIIRGLKGKKGKDKAVTGTKICKAMKIDGARLRKIISYIRVNDLMYGLCSSSVGYYTAENITELEECIISLKQRVAAQVKVLNSLEKQTLMFGGSVQTSLFE